MGRDNCPDRHLTSSSNRTKNLTLFVCALAPTTLPASSASSQYIEATIVLPDVARLGVDSVVVVDCASNRVISAVHAVSVVPVTQYNAHPRLDSAGTVDRLWPRKRQ